MSREDPVAIRRGWLVGITLAFMLNVLVAGCAGTPPQPRPKTAAPTPRPVQPGSSMAQPAARKIPSMEVQLRAEVRRWQGTRHKMGGTSRSGVDCSGFVQQLYRSIFNRSIPRSTALQVQSGQPVALTQLSPGDLVFFLPPYKVRHVGIYLGDGQFAHASTSKGVMISNLSETYWRNCYWTARRYIPN